MGCLFLLGLIVRTVFVFGHFPKTIYSGVAVGAVAGLIAALATGDWFLVGYGCLWGLLGGIVFELIVRLIVRIDNRRRTHQP